MKKSFSIVAAFCLGLFVSIAVVSCAIDGDENVQSKPNSSELSSSPVIDCIYYNDQWEDLTISFDYSNDGRIKALHYSDENDNTYTFSINYNDKKATITCASSGTRTVTFKESLDLYSAEKINSQVMQAFTMFGIW